MKKSIIKVLAFAMLLMPVYADTHEWIQNGFLKWTFTVENGVATVTMGEIRESDVIGGVTIPSSVLVEEKQGLDIVYTWYPVKYVDPQDRFGILRSQYYCSALSVGNGIEEIGSYAFSNYRLFTGVSLPTSIKRIGVDAFTGCGDLSWIAIDDLDAWCDIDFANLGANPLMCTSNGLYLTDRSYLINGYPISRPIKDLVIPEGLCEIKPYTFCGHKSLETLSLPPSCEKVGAYSFYGCSRLNSLELVDGVASIGDFAFNGCTSLQTVTMNNSLTNIGECAFKNCTSLLSVELGEGVSAIANHAFENCSRLTNIVFSTGLSSIGDLAFGGCKFSRLSLPNTVTNIGEKAFDNCRDLQSIVIPTSVRQLGSEITGGCQNLASIIGPRRFRAYFLICNPTAFYTYNDAMVSFDANGGEVDSENVLLDMNSQFGELPVPLRWNHQFLGWYTAAEGGEQVTEETVVTGDMTLYAHWEAVEYEWEYYQNQDGGITISGVSPKKGNVVIPPQIDGCYVTAIGNSAFQGAEMLTGVKIPDTVTTILGNAFGWSGLVFAIIPDSVSYIGTASFKCCYELKHLEIPQNVEIDQGAFQVCTKLADENGFTIINNTVYGYFGEESNVVIPYGIEGIGYGTFWGGDNGLQSIDIPDTVTRIESWAFYACRQLASVTIPNGVTRIERVSFDSCSSLTNAVIPEGVVSIDESAFSHCDSLASITIPASVTNIGEKAFYFSKSLETVTFAGGIDGITIAIDAFDRTPWGAANMPFEMIVQNGAVTGFHGGCPPELIVSDWPESVTRVGGYAFQNSDGLKSVAISDRICEIEYNAFRECPSLESVELSMGLKSIGVQAFWADALTEVYIPASVTNIGWGAFGLNRSLRTVHLPILLRDQIEASEAFINCAGDLEIVYYTPPMAEVTFYANGGDMAESSVSLVIGTSFDSLPVPSRSGYWFAGWWTEPSGGERVTAKTVVTTDMTLYAHWQTSPIFHNTSVASPWTIDDDGVWRSGDVSYQSDSSWMEINVIGPCTISFKWMTSNESMSLGLEVDGNFEFSNYAWGWGADSRWVVCSREISSEGEHTVRISIYSSTDTPEYGLIKDFVVAEKCVVTLDANGGWLNGDGAIEWTSVTYNPIGNLPSPTRSGYAFAGWYTAAEGGKQVTEETVVTGDMTLYAQWKESPFTNWGGDAPWSVDADESGWRSGTITDGQSTWIELAVTNAPCLVTFNWKTSSESGYDKLLCYLDGSAAVSPISGIMDDWNNVAIVVKEPGAHMVRFEYSKDGSVSNGEDCGWVKDFTVVEIKTHALTLDANGGSVNGSAAERMSVIDGAAIGQLPTPVWGGEDARRFVGWYTMADGGDNVTETTIVSVEWTSIYAHWRVMNPPSNDNFADATTISGASGSVAGTTIDSTREPADLIPEEVSSCSSTVWYKWTAPSDGKFTFSVSDSDAERSWSSYIGATMGYDKDNETWIAGNVRWGSVTIDATAGEEYWIEIASYVDTYYNEEFDFTLSWVQAPINDDYEDAQLLESSPAGSVEGTLLGATIADNDCIWRYGDAERTVWYKWVAPFTGAVRFSAEADNGRSDLLYLVATRGYDEENGDWDDCGYDNGKHVVFNVQEGETYYISIATWNYVVSGFSMSWQQLQQPENDDFADAVAISGESGRVEGSNVGASVEEYEPLPNETQDWGSGSWMFETTASVWWRWTAPKSGLFTFKTQGSDFDTVLGVYTGNSVDSLSRVAANDENGSNSWSLVEFDAVAGTQYNICAGGYSSSRGNIVLSWQRQLPEGEVIPNVEPDADADTVINAIDSVGFADANVRDAINGSASEYAAFKSWAGGVAGGEAAVVASGNAAASYLLGAERLFVNAPRIEFGECEFAADSGDVTVLVTVKDGEDVVAVASEKVKELFEATKDIADWESAEKKLTTTVTVLTQGQSENLIFKVRPGDGTAPKAFLRIRK